MNHQDDTKTYNIRELNLEIINPNTDNFQNSKQGGHKIVIIGKPGTGKSTLISSILYNKKHIIPIGYAMSGTEAANHFYSSIMPDTFVYEDYDEESIKQSIERQHIALKHLNIPGQNPWAVSIIDDCTDDPKLFNKVIQQKIFKLGRHWKWLYLLSLQYCMDVPRNVRSNIDGVFLLRETLLTNRRTLYENYASIIPTFDLFCSLMDTFTENYGALYIHTASKSNNWQDCVFYYKAKIPPSDFKFGCREYWNYHFQRYNPDHVNTFHF